MRALIGLLFGSGLWLAIQSFSSPRRARTLKKKRHVWPTFIDEVASGIQVGMSLSEAFFEARNTLPIDEKTMLERAYYQVQHGSAFTDVITKLSAQIHSKDFSRMANLLVTSSQQGIQQLPELLHDFASAIRRNNELNQDVQAKYHTNKIAARVASVAPLFVLLFTATRTEVRDIYLTHEGMMVLVIIAFVSIGGYVAMTKIASLPELES